jgi:hypothetical protein
VEKWSRNVRKTIVRSITATTILSGIVTLNEGKPELTDNKPIIVNGVVDDEKALKLVQKSYGATSIVTEKKEDTAVYEISVEDFIKYAKKVENPTDEQKEEGNKEQGVN